MGKSIASVDSGFNVDGCLWTSLPGRIYAAWYAITAYKLLVICFYVSSVMQKLCPSILPAMMVYVTFQQ